MECDGETSFFSNNKSLRPKMHKDPGALQKVSHQYAFLLEFDL
jgi:hypothetical protein